MNYVSSLKRYPHGKPSTFMAQFPGMGQPELFLLAMNQITICSEHHVGQIDPSGNVKLTDPLAHPTPAHLPQAKFVCTLSTQDLYLLKGPTK